jgi:hypothetical protein
MQAWTAGKNRGAGGVGDGEEEGSGRADAVVGAQAAPWLMPAGLRGLERHRSTTIAWLEFERGV